MSCGRGINTFRLLDGYTGWDPSKVEQIEGVDGQSGIYLGYPGGEGLDGQSLNPLIPPPSIAPGCEPCTWYLLTPALRTHAHEGGLQSRVMRKGPCTDGFERLLEVEARGIALASSGPYLAVATEKLVWVFALRGLEAIARIPLPRVKAIAFAPWPEILVAVDRSGSLQFRRYSVTGEYLGSLPATIDGTIDRMAFSRDCRLWVVTAENSSLTAWVLEPGGSKFAPATLADLQGAFPSTSLFKTGSLGFELQIAGNSGEVFECFYNYFGRCTDADGIGVSVTRERTRQGQLLTLPLDSGVPRCRWHRLRIDADVPRGCAVELALATSEDPSPVPQGDASGDPAWSTFSPGIPHPNDWQGNQAALDFLVQQPPGRYLFVRIRLTGDGTATPLVRRVRLDFERNTSLEHLPAVYRDNPDAEDFTERFLSIFDAQIEELDDAIQAAPALLRGNAIPDELLPWLASFLDAGFDQDWSNTQRRQILAALPALYRKRGTVEGMREVLALVFGTEAVITEFGLSRAWGTLGNTAVVGQTRLFSRGRSRFQLGRSGLCAAPLNNFGDARQDPFQVQAYRFGVTMPGQGDYGPIVQNKLISLIEAQKPAHTVASTVRAGGDGFFVGRDLVLGADTLLAPLPPSVLGSNGTARLNRRTILYSKRPTAGLHLRAGIGTRLDCEMVLR